MKNLLPPARTSLFPAINSKQVFSSTKLPALLTSVVIGFLTMMPGMSNAQLMGTKNIPGDYATIALAVADLNSQGVGAGGVTFNVMAGHSETSDIPVITATGTASDPITFQKFGGGTNPKIRPLTAGTVASSTTLGSHGDGIVVINGGDYITFNGIDLETDPAFVGSGMYEYGYYLQKASGTNACKNITIRNCSLTLNKAAIYSFGVFISNISGTTTVTVTTTGGRSENIKVYNVAISNSYGGIQLRGYAASSPYDLYDQNNWIGEDGGNTISNFGGGATTAYGVYAIYQNDLKINNHNISGGDNTTTTHYGIFISTAINSNIEIDSNTISLTNNSTTSQVTGIAVSAGATTGTTNTQYITNNSITNISRPSATSGVTYFIYSTSNYPLNLVISGNTIGGSTLAGTGAVHGIYQISNPVNVFIENNTVSNITRSGTTATATMYGINCDNTTATTMTTVAGNVISSLMGNGSSGAIGGIIVGTQATINVYNNKIYNITSDNASGVVYGLTLATGVVTYNVYNNLIGDLKAPSTSSTTDAIRGINITSATANSNVNVSYNTVYLNASSVGANFTTSGMYHTTSATATTATLNLRNNIIVNLSTPSGTGLAVGYRRSSTTLTNYGSVSNLNLFYAGIPGASRVIFYDGTNSDQTIAAYKTRVAPRDAGSFTENPPFLSTTGSSGNFLHIDETIGTQLESGGMMIAGITDDYDGDSRNVSTPDVGADEFNGIGVDLTSPSITYPLVPNAACLSNPIVMATITDASGINTTAGTKPRVWYKKTTNANSLPATNDNTTDGWKYTEASNSSSPFSLAIDFSLVFGGVSLGDTVQYFVVAQDLATTPNLGIHQGTFSTPPPTVALNSGAFPVTNTNNFKLQPVIPTSVTVGALGSTYPSLSGPGGLFADLNTRALSGNTIVTLDSTTITETGANALNAVAYGCGGPFTLTIQPAGGKAVLLTGTSGASASGLIKLNGADNVIIDGLNTGGSSLTIENTSTNAGTTAIWLASAGAGVGATNNTIKNCTIKAGVAQNGATTNTYGIVLSGSTISATHSSISAGEDNDNNVFMNNTFIKSRYGIYIRGGSSTNPNIGTMITNNTFGPSAFGTDEIGKGAILVREEDGTLISGNTIHFVGGDYANTSGGSDRAGITFGVDVAWPPASVYVRNALVTKNNIHDIIEERTFSAVGINVGAADGSNNTNNVISNNFIFNIKANGTVSDQSIGIGINASKNDRIVYNTIYMTGDTDPNASAASPSQDNFCISIGSGSVVDPLIKDNIVYMDLTSSSNPNIMNACINVPASFAWGTGSSNYNDLYYLMDNPQSNTGCVGGSGGTFHLTLANWQTAVSQDANSVNIVPVFVSPSDLHLLPAGNMLFDNLGSPVAGVTMDIDNDVRNGTTPDIGADEFTAASGVDMGATALVSPGVSGCYGASETVTVTIRNYSTLLMNFSVNNTTVNVTTNTGYNSNILLTSGTLASGATMNVNMPATIDMTSNGTFTFNATTTASGDIYSGNDAMPPSNRVNFALGGSYTVGAAGNYSSITAAIVAYSSMTCCTGPIIFNLIDATYPETFPIVINHNTVAGSNTLTIQPAAGNAVTISGTSSTGGIIDLNGADHIIIDGLNTGGSSLLIRNTSTTIPVIRFINDATYNVITNATIEGAVTSTTSGMILFSTSASGTTGNSNNYISACNIRDRSDATSSPGNGIYSSGTAAAPNASNIISNNDIFNFFSSGINLASTGIGNNWQIMGNDIYNAQSPSSALTQNGVLIAGGIGHVISSNFIGGNAAGASGTWTNTGNVIVNGISNITTSVANIHNNTVANINMSNAGTSVRLRGISNTSNGDSTVIDSNTVFSLLSMGAVTGFGAGSQPAIGIYGFPSSTNHIYFVSNNIVHHISAENTTALTTSIMSVGIELTNFVGACYNNKIFAIQNKGTGITAGQPPIANGMYVRFLSPGFVYNNFISLGEGESNNVQYNGIQSVGAGTAGNDQYWYNNSVRIGGTATGTFTSHAFLRGDNTPTSPSHPTILKNNILDMLRSGGGSVNYAIASQGTNADTAWISDYNDLYNTDANNIGYWFSAGYNFADWKTTTGQDMNSVSVLPSFFSVNDLHLDNTNVSLDNAGTDIDSLEFDIDNQPRNFLTPDIGADEFTTGCSNIVMNTNDIGGGSLRDVISCIPPGESVLFTPGLTGQTITLTSGEIVINKSLGIAGLGKANLTISGNNSSRIFNLQPTYEMRIRDVALKNATSLTNGGAILVGSTLLLQDALFENNLENGIPKSMTILPSVSVEVRGSVDLNE